MKTRVPIFILSLGIAILCGQLLSAKPPFSGTIFIDPDIITPEDPTAFESLSEAGQAMRQMFDRRVPGWIEVKAFLFNAIFDDGLDIEVQVNPEFGNSSTALAEARKYSEIIGRLPTALRADVETVWIHKGTEPFGGGNNNLLIHTGQAEQYTNSGILEETLVHEAAHSSLDADHAKSVEWLSSQDKDANFISTYARDFPTREDIAESFLPYLALRYRSDRISPSLATTIAQSIPNRIAYFDDQSLDMYPIVQPEPVSLKELSYDQSLGTVKLSWASGSGKIYRVITSTDLTEWTEFWDPIRSGGIETTLELDASEPQRFFRVRTLLPNDE